MALTGFGLTHRYLNENEIETILVDSLAGMPLDGKRLLVLIPDSTRTMPLPLFFSRIVALLQRRLICCATGSGSPHAKSATVTGRRLRKWK